MYNILIFGTDKLHEYEELVKAFLPTDEFRLFTDIDMVDGAGPVKPIDAVFSFHGDKNQVKFQLYQYMWSRTGKRPPWGIITGIRPVKLTGELLRKFKDPNLVQKVLTENYLVTGAKARQVIEMVYYQQQSIGSPMPGSVGIYVGIPFCPSRCAYCSFPSYQTTTEEMEPYVKTLLLEIKFVAKSMKEHNWYAETIYIGGGTPTSLNSDQLERLYGTLNESFSGKDLLEFSLEAGRPDTITFANMSQAVKAGVTRVSINPQTMNEKTLERIGRNHTKSQVNEAFRAAKSAGFKLINTDIIAGLPDETIKDFEATLDEILLLEPQNVTVHSLAMKRASRLTGQNSNFHHEQADVVAEMLAYGEACLEKRGYVPYYLYRQKQMAGSLENVGYCLPGTENIYNVRMMEENQTIIAVGAGGISKAYFPVENRLERIPNVSNYEIYIQRLDEMIIRKEKDLFRRFETC